jgi:hypothetical protein
MVFDKHWPVTQSSLFKLVINTTLLVGVCAAILMATHLTEDKQFELKNVSYPLLVGLIFSQAVALCIAVTTWETALRMLCGLRTGFSTAFVHVAFVLIGKYVPGKIWGLVGRHYLLKRIGGNDLELLRAAMIEQFLLIHSGLTVGSLALGFALLIPAPALLVGLIILGAVLLSPPVFAIVMRFTMMLASSIPAIKRRLAHSGDLTLSNCQYMTLISLHCLSWITIGSIVCLIALFLEIELTLQQHLIVGGAFVLAVNAGFFLLLAPGGIGVREGVFIALVAPTLGAEAAIIIAVTHRLFITLYDIAVGSIGYLVYHLTSEPPTNAQ